jgi:tetratricopeptide (TPR) repeat protein
MLPRTTSYLSILLLALAVLCASACKKSAAPGSMAASADAEMMAGEAGPGDGGASPTTWKQSTLAAHTSRLRVGDSEDLPLKSTEIRARVDGFRARVMIDFVFENPHAVQLEGDFQMRLPQGASPYYLAFGRSVAVAGNPPLQIASDADSFAPTGAIAARQTVFDQPREAVMAERERAAIAYGQTVRRRVDPAIAEWSGAGVFDAHVFPIEPGATHRVVVGYDVDLTRLGDDLLLELPVPAHGGTTALELDVAELAGATAEVTPGAAAQTDAGRSYWRFESPQDKAVTLRLRDVPSTVLVGEDAGVGPLFATRLAPQLPAGAAANSSRTAVLAIDTSLSANPERFEIWRTLAGQILENDPDIERFAVLTFDVQTRWWQPRFVANTAANRKALGDFTDTAVLEGATDLGAALDAAARPQWLTEDVAYDTFLLSDGAATWGEDDGFSIATRWREADGGALFAYDTGIAGGSPEFLATLARETGGAVFSVMGASEVTAAAAAHRARPWTIESVTVDGAEDLVLEGRPRTLFSGQRLTLVGRGQVHAGATVQLQLRQGGTQETLSLPIEAELTTDLAPRRYGQVAVGQLEELGAPTRKDAVVYARHFRVTGRTCSLVMLETDEDYENAGIGGHDDAAAVRSRPLGRTIAKALQRFGQTLGDPKARMLADIEHFSSTAGVELKLPADMRERLQSLPRAAFEVEAEPLACKDGTRARLPSDLRAQLRKREPEYDTAVREAERREAAGDIDCALVALSSMVEASPGDAVLARDVAFTAASWGLTGQAVNLLLRVARARPYEPITYHALGQTLAEAGEPELAIAFFELALAGNWDARFGDFHRIAALDYLRLLRTQKGDPSRAGFARTRIPDLNRRLDLEDADLVITIMWNTDATDVDLHVHEPGGGHCFYGNRTTRTGRLTADVTQGYGPEMYVAKRTRAGRYRVRAHYFASRSDRLGARTKVYATVIRGFGTPQESVERKVVTLVEGKDEHHLVNVRGRQ